MPTLTQCDGWRALRAHQQTMAKTTMAQLFAADPRRFENFSLQSGDLLLDYSKNLVDVQTMTLLAALARERAVPAEIERMFCGEHINNTEDRAVLHTALRGRQPVMVDGADVMPQVRDTLERMCEYVAKVRAAGTITDVVSIGIGGSHLGPALATLALAPYAGGPRVHYLSNVDGAAVHRILQSLDPAKTLVVIISKTFTTTETLTNARTVRAWLMRGVDRSRAEEHFAAVTANTTLAREFGIAADSVFPFWDWVGGRYSLWSSVGLPLALAVGGENFSDLLEGAHAMDEHFRHAPPDRNLPVLLALLGIWYNNFFGAESHAVIPYDDSLALLSAFLQQLDMESSGKRVRSDGSFADCATGQVIWGAPGTDAQHSFFQLLHQGTRMIPVDFIGVCQSQVACGAHHDILMANFFAQTEALMNGTPDKPAGADSFPGNRPSNSILLRKLTPHALGMLLALYEHKVFVQNVIWGLNAFDQPGVELGKRLAARILPELAPGAAVTAHDASTRGLVNYYKTHRQ